MLLTVAVEEAEQGWRVFVQLHVFEQTRDADAVDADVVVHPDVLVRRRVDKTRNVSSAVYRVVT